MDQFFASGLSVDLDLVARLKFGADGLIPVIVTDEEGVVLMLAYSDVEAVRRTLETKHSWFYSRSRQAYWEKGATSGNFQVVREIRTDCDFDALLYQVEQVGSGACHNGTYSCFTSVVAQGSER
ncbi:MAG: phosphoribosyl-AMP cyclohydrolase [Acidimicrobiales bacterium]